jgi:hypothetical protein
MQNPSLLSEAYRDNSAGLRTIGVDIKASGPYPNEYQLVLKGFLSPGWTGRLTAGLAQHRVGIVTGEAEKVTSSAWHSTFKLKSAPFAKDPLTIDYASLASTELPFDRSAGKIALRSFAMEPASRHQGSLYLEVKGVDRLGFLGDLLDYFSMRCLFPVKMIIETHGDSALDRFWLRGVGGSVPSETVASAMQENLQRLLIGNA